MIKYKDFKDYIIYYDSLFGELTLDDLMNELEYYIKWQKEFENTVYDILKKQNFDDEVLSSLFTLSTIESLDTTIKMIKNEL